MGKTLNCPYCNNDTTYKVVYCYRNHNKRKEKINYDDLLKEGTIFKDKGSYLEKYDFDGERIPNKRYNKYCPNCKRYFYSIGKMCTNDITNIVLVSNKENHLRLDIDLKDDRGLVFTIKENYIPIIENGCYNEKNGILQAIKKYKKNPLERNYEKKNNYEYFLILKFKYYNGLTECYFNNDVLNNFSELLNEVEKITEDLFH